MIDITKDTELAKYLIERFGDGKSELLEGEEPQDWKVKNPSTYTFEELLNERSSDGDHDEWNVVVQCDETGQCFRFCGWYTSENGADFDDAKVEEVVAKEKIVIVYHKKEV